MKTTLSAAVLALALAAPVRAAFEDQPKFQEEKKENPFNYKAANKALLEYAASHPKPVAGPPSPKQESKNFHKFFNEQDKKPKHFPWGFILTNTALNGLSAWDVRETRAGIAEFPGGTTDYGTYSVYRQFYEANSAQAWYVNGSGGWAYGSQIAANALITWSTEKLIKNPHKGWKITGWTLRVMAGGSHAYLALDARNKREHLRNLHP